MDNNNNKETLKKAAMAGAAEASKTSRTTGFTPPGSRASSTPKGPNKSSPQFKPGPPAINLNLRPQKPNPTPQAPTPAPTPTPTPTPAPTPTPTPNPAPTPTPAPTTAPPMANTQPDHVMGGEVPETGNDEPDNPGNRTTADISSEDSEDIEEVLLPLGLSDKPALEVVQEVIQAHNRIKAPSEDNKKSVEMLHHHMDDKEGRVPELGPAAKMTCLLYTSPSPRDRQKSRMPSSA